MRAIRRKPALHEDHLRPLPSKLAGRLPRLIETTGPASTLSPFRRAGSSLRRGWPAGGRASRCPSKGSEALLLAGPVRSRPFLPSRRSLPLRLRFQLSVAHSGRHRQPLKGSSSGWYRSRTHTRVSCVRPGNAIDVPFSKQEDYFRFTVAPLWDEAAPMVTSTSTLPVGAEAGILKLTWRTPW